MEKAATHVGIYALGNILRRMVSFVMLPIYTRFLTTSDYGTLELLSMIIDFTSIVVGMRIGSAIFRFYTKYEDKMDKNEVISTSLILVGVANSFGVIGIILFAKPLSFLIFGNNGFSHYTMLFSLTLIFQALVEVPMIFIRAQQRPWLFVSISTMKLILQLSLNIYFVVVKHMHVEGVIYSALISGLIMSLTLVAYTFYNTGFRFGIKKSKELFSFSFPLVIASLISFYLTFGDRYFLRLFDSISEVGVYSLGYKFGFILVFLVWHPFSNVWDVQKYKIYKKQNAKKIFQEVFLLMSLILITFSLGIAVFSKDLLRIMSAPEFVPAYKIVPIILAAYMVQCCLTYCNLGILIKEKTSNMAIGTFVSAIVISIGYFTLIPKFGIYGAAWSTLIGFLARCIWISVKSRKYYAMNLPWAKVSMLVILSAVIYFFSLMAPPNIFASIGVHSFLIMCFITLVFIMPILEAKQKRSFISFLRNPLSIKSIFKA